MYLQSGCSITISKSYPSDDTFEEPVEFTALFLLSFPILIHAHADLRRLGTRRFVANNITTLKNRVVEGFYKDSCQIICSWNKIGSTIKEVKCSIRNQKKTVNIG